MSFAAFGPGIIIVTRTDLAQQTPINIGYAQSLSLDIAGEVKPLYGTYQFPLVQARGTIKASGKFVAAEISGIAWNSFFYGQSSFSAGGFQWNIGEQHTIPAGGTLTVTNSTNYDDDLGVIFDASRLPAQKTPSAPAAGYYAESAGVYTFNTAQVGLVADVTYTSTVTTGQSLLVTSQVIGTTPTFQLDYYTNLNRPALGPTPFAVRVFACVAAKHSLGFKLSDFMMPEFDFEFFSLPNLNVLQYVFPEIS